MDLIFRKRSFEDERGYIYCTQHITPKRRTKFTLGIAITHEEWDTYINVNYYTHKCMPSTGIPYYKFADVMDEIQKVLNEVPYPNTQKQIKNRLVQMYTRSL